MTPEEKDLIKQIRNADLDVRRREKALSRIGELLEETFILDLLPDKTLMRDLEAISADTAMPASLKRKAKSLLKTYSI